MEREYHVHISCNWTEMHLDGLPEQDGKDIPEHICRGVRAIYALLETRIPGLTWISIMGTWIPGKRPTFCAFDLWAQTGEEGWYLPMETTAALFRDNGIPYYHYPPLS
ncbi:MAG: hypothetical protein J5669_00600 [Bacteroidales bacterium]|nr:hypothetical protein [Bacteroidales bacterium]